MSTAVQLEAQAKFPKHAAGGKTDPKAWAKQIVYRFEHGDKSIKKAQIDSAREALANKSEEP
jgi:hypothetical protein